MHGGEIIGNSQQPERLQQIETGLQIQDVVQGIKENTPPTSSAIIDDRTYREGESDYVHRRRHTDAAIAYIGYWASQNS